MIACRSTHEFTYDRYGNRTAQSISSGCTGITCPTNSVTVSASTNQITGSPYTYDANGNMTNDGMNAMVYDAENRVVSISGSLGSATYAYDGQGHRVQKTSSGTTTTYVYAGDYVISEYSAGTLSHEYIRAGANLLAEYDSGTLAYHGRDQLSVRLNMDSNGNVVGQQGHFPFGEDWYMTNSTTKWQFTSYERDSESGNDHATFRYHINRLGRFSSVDPVPARRGSDPQTLNRYTYVASNPITVKDRNGRFFVLYEPEDPNDSCDDWYDAECSCPPSLPMDFCGGGGGYGGGGVGCNDGANCGGGGQPAPAPPPPPKRCGPGTIVSGRNAEGPNLCNRGDIRIQQWQCASGCPLSTCQSQGSDYTVACDQKGSAYYALCGTMFTFSGGAYYCDCCQASKSGRTARQVRR